MDIVFDDDNARVLRSVHNELVSAVQDDPFAPKKKKPPKDKEEAKKEGVKNFSLFCNHITIIPTIKAILDSPDLQLDGFLGPGHVVHPLAGQEHPAEHALDDLQVLDLAPHLVVAEREAPGGQHHLHRLVVLAEDA